MWRVTGGHPGLVSAAGIILAGKSRDAEPLKWEHSSDTPLLQSKFEASVAMGHLRRKMTTFLSRHVLPGGCVAGLHSA